MLLQLYEPPSPNSLWNVQSLTEFTLAREPYYKALVLAFVTGYVSSPLALQGKISCQVELSIGFGDRLADPEHSKQFRDKDLGIHTYTPTDLALTKPSKTLRGKLFFHSQVCIACGSTNHVVHSPVAVHQIEEKEAAFFS